MEIFTLTDAINELREFNSKHKITGMFCIVIGKDGKKRNICCDYDDKAAKRLLKLVEKGVEGFRKQLSSLPTT